MIYLSVWEMIEKCELGDQDFTVVIKQTGLKNNWTTSVRQMEGERVSALCIPLSEMLLLSNTNGQIRGETLASQTDIHPSAQSPVPSQRHDTHIIQKRPNKMA